MPVSKQTLDEYGIPIRTQPSSAVDEYGIPVKTKNLPTPNIDFNALNAQHGKLAPTIEGKNLAQQGAQVLEHNVGKRNSAIDNTIQRKYKNLGLKIDKNSPQYKKEFQQTLNALQNGDIVQTTNQRTGEPTTTRSSGFWESTGNSLVESFKAPIEAGKINTLSGKELADYLDKKASQEPDVPESLPSPFLGQLGMAAGGFPKVAGLFALNEVAPGLGTTAAAAEAQWTSTAAHTEQLYHKWLKQLTDSKMPLDEARIQAADHAKKDAPLAAAPDALMTAALGEMGGNAAALEKSAQTFKDVLLKSGKSVGKMAVLGGTSEAARTGIEKAQGLNVTMQDAIDNFGKGGFQWATMDAMFKIAPIVSKMPSAAQSAWKEYMSKVPKEFINEYEQTMGEQGTQLKKTLDNYEKAKEKVPDYYSDEHKPVLADLVQKKDELEKKKETTDKSFHDDIDKQIETIDQTINVVKNSKNPTDIHVDELTGETNGKHKDYEDLTKPEREGIEVPKDYGEVDVREVGKDENKKFVPQAYVINEKGALYVKKPIKVEGEFTDKTKAKEAAEQALKQHYYENSLADHLKPEKSEKQKEEVIQQQGVERNQPSNEPISTEESSIAETKPVETIQPQQEQVKEQKPSILGSDVDFDKVKDNAKDVEAGQPLDDSFETRMAIRDKAKKDLNVQQFFDALPEKTKKSLEGRKSDLFYKGENWRTVIEKSALNPDMWAKKEVKRTMSGDKLLDFQESDKYYLYGADNNKTYKREIPKEYFDYFNSIKQEYNRLIDKTKPQDIEIQANTENNITSPINTEQDALQEQSAGSVLQHTQEGTGETGGGRERVESSIEGNEPTGTRTQEESKTTGEEKNVSVHSEYPPTSISYQGTGKLETEFGIDERQQTVTKHDIETIKEADGLIEKGWDAQKELNKLASGEKTFISDAEYINFTKYAAELSSRLRNLDVTSPEYDRTLTELNRVANVANAAGKETGRALGIRARFKTVQDGTYADFMLNELNANNDAPLTDNQKQTAQNDWNKFNEAREQFEKDKQKFDDEVAKFEAEKELNKTKKTSPKNTKKTHEDYVKDRNTIIEAAKEKIKKAREKANDPNTQKMGIGGRTKIDDLFTIAPEVLKLAKSFVEEGLGKLEDVVKQLHESFKDVVEDLNEKDIHNIIAGNYNEKKQTKKEVAIQMENLRIEAQLINKYEALLKGEQPKTEKAKIKRNQEIEDLRNKIKDFRKEQSEENKFYPEQKDKDFKVLETLKNKNQKETARLKEKIAKGDFAPEEKRIPTLQNKEFQKKFPQAFKEAQKSRDELIKTKQQIELRRAKQLYEQRTPQEKFQNLAVRVLNVPRTLMASMDLSAPFRQGVVASAAHPITAAKAFKFMLNAAKDEKIYNRWLDEVHSSPLWEDANKSGLAITDPNTLHLQEKEEAFLGGNLAEQIPVAGKLVKGSERAYIGFLNKMRWDLFTQYAEALRDVGKTYDNNPELYKGYASFINASTGRGGMAFGEAASPVLSSLLFSPRLIASRMNMLGLTDIPNLVTRAATFGKRGVDYGFYSKLPKEIRVQAAKDMLKFLAAGISTLGLAVAYKKVTGDESVSIEADPRSSDFGKIVSGNTRWDIWGGFQPYARLLSQVVTGQSKSTNTGKIYDLDGSKFGGRTVGDQLATFGRGKLAPVWGTIGDIVTQRTLDQQTLDRTFDIPFYSGDNPQAGHITLTDEFLKDLTPLLINDIREAMKDKGISALFTVGIPSALGVGVQTYEPKPTKTETKNTHSTSHSHTTNHR